MHKYREFGSLLIEIGFGVVFFFLPSWFPNMPDWMIYSSPYIGGALILVGIVMFFWKSKKKVEIQEATPANNSGISIQRAENSPVVQASSGGFASAGDIHLTQNFFPPTILQSISTSVSGGRIEVRHIPDNSSFKFAVLNDTNSDLRNCVVYIDEIAYKSDEDKSWNRLDDLPSEKPLRWITTVLPTIDGSYDIDAGKRLSFVMINKSSRYFLEFFKDNVLLPYSSARSHRILIRFDGKFLLSGRVTNKFYVYFYEEILGQKIYYGIEEYQEGQ